MKTICKISLVFILILLFTSCKKDEVSTSVADIEGNIYKIVTIGTQTWMQENLKTTKLNDGTSIPSITDDSQWSQTQSSALCWLNNDATTNKNLYGALYNWHAIKTEQLCPEGWHIPSDAEWTILIMYIGGVDEAGGKLKETGTTHWNTPNQGATNEFEFTALPGGFRYNSGTFSNTGSHGLWWTNNESDNSTAWSWSVVSGASLGNRYSFPKQYGLSIRCLKD